MENRTKGTIMHIVRLKSNLAEEELMKIAREREPMFAAIPGLVQKYYIKMAEPGLFGGVYVWDSMESLQEFRESELAQTIAKSYQVLEPPQVEVVDILFSLR